MKRRVFFLVASLLIVVTSLLLAAIFQLYQDAETVQKSIFTSEVLSAGTEIVTKIDQVLKGDSIVIVSEVKEPVDSTHTLLFQKHAKKFILDASRVQPVGVIYSTINYMKNNIVWTTYDTVYFDTTLQSHCALPNPLGNRYSRIYCQPKRPKRKKRI